MSEGAIIALAVAVITTLGVKVVEYIFKGLQDRRDKQNNMLVEKQKELDAVKAEIKEIERQLDEWKERVYSLRDEKSKVDTQLMIALDQIRRLENDDSDRTQPVS